MKVKNILVNGKNVFLDILIRELIKYNISYVLIDNYEIHFDNYIIRLYDLSDILKNEVVLPELIKLTNESELLPLFIQPINNNIYDLFRVESEKEIIKNDKPKYTKKLIKQQNRIYSNMINTRKIK